LNIFSLTLLIIFSFLRNLSARMKENPTRNGALPVELHAVARMARFERATTGLTGDNRANPTRAYYL
jgi:hypothetical protein